MEKARDVARILINDYGFPCNYGEDIFGPYIVLRSSDVPNIECVLTALWQLGLNCANYTTNTDRYPRECGYVVFYI